MPGQATKASENRDAGRTWLALAAASVLVLLFVASRVAILAASLPRNYNWEEPVFLFSATELARDGLSGLFDHQDDLNHGGSLPLILLGIPWLAVSGGDLHVFKGIAILWSTLLFVANILVGWRYFSPRVGLLWGVLFLAASGAVARLNVTLIGSHPEALLPCALALAAYLEIERRNAWRDGSVRWALALGFSCAAAMWFAYSSVLFIAPVVVFWLCARPGLRRIGWFTFGAAAGALPWLYQNVILRPHGSLAFIPLIRSVSAPETIEPWTWNGLLASFELGFGPPAPVGMWGASVVGAAVLLGFVLLVRVVRGGAGERFKLGPFLIAPLIGLASVALASPPFHTWAGHANYRFFVPVHAAIYWVIAIGTERGLGPVVRFIAPAIAIGVLAHAVSTQRGLYETVTVKSKSLDAVRMQGCRVYGLAEVHRSADRVRGMARLSELSDTRCRKKAIETFEFAYPTVFGDGKDSSAPIQE